MRSEKGDHDWRWRDREADRRDERYDDRYASRDREGYRDRDKADDRGARHRSNRYEREYHERSTSPRYRDDAARRRDDRSDRDRNLRYNDRRAAHRRSASRLGSRPGSPAASERGLRDRRRGHSPDNTPEPKSKLEIQADTLEAKFDAQVRQLAKSFDVDFEALEGHGKDEPLWDWVHNKFFGPTREMSYHDNWDGELDDMVAMLQSQAGVQLPLDDPRFMLAAAAEAAAAEAAAAEDDRPPLPEHSPYETRADERHGPWEVPEGASPPPDPRPYKAVAAARADGGASPPHTGDPGLPLPRWVMEVAHQAAQSVFLEQARAAATALAAAALAPMPRPDAEPAATEVGSDSDSDLSWAQQPRARDGEDYAESSPRGGSEEHHPPAAPRHETRLADDDAAGSQPLTLEQMAAQSWYPQDQPAVPQEEPPGGGYWRSHRQAVQREDPEDGEHWSHVDIDGRLVDRRSLQELRRCAQDGRFGLVLGAAVARREHDRRSVWLPLTQDPIQTGDLQWAGADAVPSREQLAEQRAAALTALRPLDSEYVAACGAAAAAGGSPSWQFDAVAVRPPPAEAAADAGAFGRDTGPAAASNSAADAAAAAAARAAPQQAAWRCNPSAPEAEAEFQAFDLRRAAARHRACRIDATIQALDDKWRRKERAARRAARALRWGPPPPPHLPACVAGELAASVFAAGATAKLRLELLRRGLPAALPDFEALRAEGAAERAEKARVEAERQERERAQHAKHEADRRARRQQEEQAIEDAAIEAAKKKRAAERATEAAAAAAATAAEQNDGASTPKAGRGATAKPPWASSMQPASGRKRGRDADSDAADGQTLPPDSKPQPRARSPVSSAPKGTPPKGKPPQGKGVAKRQRAAMPASPSDKGEAPGSEDEASPEPESPIAAVNGHKRRNQPAARTTAKACGGAASRHPKRQKQQQKQQQPASPFEASGSASGDGAASASESGEASASEDEAQSESGSSSGSDSDFGGAAKPARQKAAANAKAKPKQPAARKRPAAQPAKAAPADARPDAAEADAEEVPPTSAETLALLKDEVPGAERLARLNAEEADLMAGGKRPLQRQGSSCKRGGSAGPAAGGDGSGSDGDEDPEAVMAAKREAVELNTWKQAVPQALLDIHKQVEAFDDEKCDQIFLKPVTDKMCPGYSEAVKQPTCLAHIGKEFNVAKKWPRTRRALERYYANISLMCDNCRLYNEGFKAYEGYANEMQAFVKRLVDEAQRKIELQVKSELFSLESRMVT